jgi:hypothetical protein
MLFINKQVDHEHHKEINDLPRNSRGFGVPRSTNKVQSTPKPFKHLPYSI